MERSPDPEQKVTPVTVHVPVRTVRAGDATTPPTLVVDGSAHPELADRLRWLAATATAPSATWNDDAADWGLAVLAVALPAPGRGGVDRVLATTVSVLELGADAVRRLEGAELVHLEVGIGPERIGPVAVVADAGAVARALTGAGAGAVPTARVRPLRVLAVDPPAAGGAAPPTLRLDAVGSADVVRRLAEAARRGARALSAWQPLDDGRGLVLVVRVGDVPTTDHPPVLVSATFAPGSDRARLARLAAADAFTVELVDGAATHRLVVGHDRSRLTELLAG